MTTKIIEFPYEFLKRKKQPSFTPLMIDTLLAACQKQKEKNPLWAHGYKALLYGIDKQRVNS